MENKRTFISVAAVIILVVTVLSVTINSISGSLSKKNLDDLMKKVNYTTAEPVKGTLSLNENSLYDELPEITKYPLAVEGEGDVDIEIFTSGEKAGNGNDSWLIDCAVAFNTENRALSNGKTVSVSVRSVSSGLAADYIASGKYLPDLYTPSNTLFGESCISQGGKIALYNERLVGNTAGLLISKDAPYASADEIINAVVNGEINIGYTNPQTSATGLNLLMTILNSNGGIYSKEAAEVFSKFNRNIPFVAYTTQQMRDSASSGTLDGMVTEYQTYINDKTLVSLYNFIPFGERHDNPLYVVNQNRKSDAEMEAIGMINDYLMSKECQNIATKYGFNANNDYNPEYHSSGSEIAYALNVYKKNKDAGQDIIAVFVADCSGSMSGAPIQELKASLTNGIQYINENNYIGLVSYSSGVTVELPIERFNFNQKAYFQGAVDRLTANGGTASYEAVTVALSMIQEARTAHPDAKCMLFLLTDGYANGRFSISTIENAVRTSGVPVYTIGYTSDADMDALSHLSGINEAATIKADSDDIIYKIKSLFNSQL